MAIFSTLIERMMCETVTIDDAKALLLGHEWRFKRRKVVQILPLPSFILSNVVAKNPPNDHDSIFYHLNGSLPLWEWKPIQHLMLKFCNYKIVHKCINLVRNDKYTSKVEF